jgi:hypothetical protein
MALVPGNPQVALVLCLAEDSEAGLGRQAFDRIVRRLADERLPATCMALSSRQSGMVQAAQQSGAAVEAGLQLTGVQAGRASSDAWLRTTRELASMRSAGLNPVALWAVDRVVVAEQAAGYHQLGVRVIARLADGAAATDSRAELVEGVWTLGGAVTAPELRSWPLPTCEEPWKSLSRQGLRPAIVALDFRRVGGLASRGMRHVERLLTKAAAAQDQGHAEFVGLAQWARRQLGRTAGQPQRSILHAA